MLEYKVLCEDGGNVICLSPLHSAVFQTDLARWRDYIRYGRNSELGRLITELGLCTAPDLSPNVSGALGFTNLVLNLTSRCNFRCTYCFQRHNGSRAMSRTVYQSAIELIPKYFNRDSCNITFFGGEPLLLFRKVKEITEYAKARLKDRQLSFSITTNGSMLDDATITFLLQNAFTSTISLDSIETTNSLTRLPKRGDPRLTYRSIARGIQTLAQEGANLSCNVVITEKNIGDLFEFSMFLHSLGVRKLSMSLVSSKNESLSTASLHDLVHQLRRITHVLMSNPDTTVDPISGLIDSLSSHKLHLYNCGYGRLRINVQPNGDITPCQRVSNVIGNVLDGIDVSFAKDRAHEHVDNRTHCRECSLRYLCGGNCYHESEVFEGNPNTPHRRYCGFFENLVAMLAKELIAKRAPTVEVPGIRLL